MSNMVLRDASAFKRLRNDEKKGEKGFKRVEEQWKSCSRTEENWNPMKSGKI